MAKEKFNLNSNLLHELVNYSTYGTILDDLFDECDFEDCLFTSDVYYSYLFDFGKYMDTIGDIIKDLMLEELVFGDVRVDVEVGKTYSPKAYNFAKDEIYITLSLDINELADYMGQFEVEFNEFLKGYYSSYSGFISFMPNSYESWTNEMDNNRFVACAVNFLYQKFNYSTISCELIYEELISNFSPFNFINEVRGNLLNNEINKLNEQINSDFHKGIETSIDLSAFTYIDNSEYIDTYIKQERANLASMGQYTLFE